MEKKLESLDWELKEKSQVDWDEDELMELKAERDRDHQ